MQRFNVFEKSLKPYNFLNKLPNNPGNFVSLKVHSFFPKIIPCTTTHATTHFHVLKFFQKSYLSCVDPEEGTGGPDPPPPLKNHKNIGVLSNNGLDPLKVTKLPSQHSMWAIIDTPAKHHLNGISLAG